MGGIDTAVGAWGAICLSADISLGWSRGVNIRVRDAFSARLLFWRYLQLVASTWRKRDRGQQRCVCVCVCVSICLSVCLFVCVVCVCVHVSSSNRWPVC